MAGPARRDRLHRRAHHGRLAGGLRRARQPHQGRRAHQLPRRALHRLAAVRGAGRRCSTRCWCCSSGSSPPGRGEREHDGLRRHVGLPLRPGQLVGQRRHRGPPRPAAAADGHRAAHGHGWSGCRSRCGWATSGRGGFLAINISNVGRAIPTFALLALLVVAPVAGHRRARPLRPRRPRHPDRADPLRAAADHHQRVRRHARGRARRAGGRPGHGDDRGASGSGASSCRSACRWSCRACGWRWCRCGRPRRSPPWSPGPASGQIITDGFFRSNYGKGIAGALVVAVVALVLELLRRAGAARRRPLRVRGTPAGGRDGRVVGGRGYRGPACRNRRLTRSIRTRAAHGCGTQKEHHAPGSLAGRGPRRRRPHPHRLRR